LFKLVIVRNNVMGESKVTEIIEKVKHLQNGDVSTAMQNMGLTYELNYGVSIPQLSELASAYNADNELAYVLLSNEIREAKILASMLFDVSKISIDQILSISTAINNIELVEQFSRNVFAKSSDLDVALPILIDIDYWQQLAAIYSAGWALKKNKDENSEIVNWSKYTISKYLESEDRHFQKSIVFLFQCLIAINNETRKEMVNLAEKLAKSENLSVQKLAQELLWISA
jgi:3-methyladenine DNA glycosylase AlkD